MSNLAVGRAFTAAAVAAALVATCASAASAAVITPGTPCARYIPGLAGQQWIPISGSGFTPNTDPTFNTVELNYSNSDLGAFTPLAPDGSFTVGVFMPSEFINSSSGRMKTYALTATDRQTPGLVASTNVTLVRAGAAVKPARVRRDLGKRVRWSIYGAPSGARMYAHWTFKGRRRATRGLGRAAGPCGIAHKRQPFLPVRARTGTWKVYFTVGKRFKRKRVLFRIDISVIRTFSSASRAARVG
jgi:hypothetical protein